MSRVFCADSLAQVAGKRSAHDHKSECKRQQALSHLSPVYRNPASQQAPLMSSRLFTTFGALRWRRRGAHHAQARYVPRADRLVRVGSAVRAFGLLTKLTLIRNHARAGDSTRSTARPVRADEHCCGHGFAPRSASLSGHAPTGGRQPRRPRPVRRSHLGSQDGRTRYSRYELTA
jgi:hypothetical protein